jgi:putative ABC transport system permease protein
VQALIHRIDPEVPVVGLRTMHQALATSLLLRRSMMLALGAFAALALVLAVGGIYAVLSYVVGRRRREIGIRMALGARRGQVIGMVIRRGVILIGVGLLIGFPVALLTARLLGTILVGVTAADPVTYAVVAMLLAATGIVAALAPARHAAAADPTTILHEG